MIPNVQQTEAGLPRWNWFTVHQQAVTKKLAILVNTMKFKA